MAARDEYLTDLDSCAEQHKKGGHEVTSAFIGKTEGYAGRPIDYEMLDIVG